MPRKGAHKEDNWKTPWARKKKKSLTFKKLGKFSFRQQEPSSRTLFFLFFLASRFLRSLFTISFALLHLSSYSSST